MVLFAIQNINSPVEISVVVSIISGGLAVIGGVWFWGKSNVDRKEIDKRFEKQDEKISKKLDESRFIDFQNEVWVEVKENKDTNELQHRMLIEDMKIDRGMSKEMLTKLSLLSENLAVVANDTMWIKDKLK